MTETVNLSSPTKNIARLFLAYNVDIFLMYASVSGFLAYLVVSSGGDIVNVLAILFANIFSVIATYTLNKISDTPEDSLNRSSPKILSNRAIYRMCFLLFFASFLFYLVPKQFDILLYGFFLLCISLFYSFPRKYRLKNIFLIKNIATAFCWSISLCLIIYSGNTKLEMPAIFSMLLPMSTMFFIFSIIWDMPDRHGDKISSVRTLPVVVGFDTTKYIVYLLLGATFFLIDSALDKIICLLLGIFIVFVSEKTPKISYHYALLSLVIIYILATVLTHS